MEIQLVLPWWLFFISKKNANLKKAQIESISTLISILTGGVKMMYLILLETDHSLLPKDTNEKMKIIASQMELGKKDLDSGELKMAGMSPDGQNGFVISTQDVKAIYTRAQMLGPYMKLKKVMPMLSIDEVVDVMKEMQK